MVTHQEKRTGWLAQCSSTTPSEGGTKHKPFSQVTHIGLPVLGNSTCVSCTFRHNQVNSHSLVLFGAYFMCDTVFAGPAVNSVFKRKNNPRQMHHFPCPLFEPKPLIIKAIILYSGSYNIIWCKEQRSA